MQTIDPNVHLRSPAIKPNKTIKIELHGAGGTGARMLYGLAGLHNSLKALGWAGLSVITIDHDMVSQSNITRGPFFPSDLGLFKAIVITHRVNLSFGLHWQAKIKQDACHSSDIVISCVDSRAARAEIAAGISSLCQYHLDCGNDSRSGQVLLGRSANTVTNLPLLGEQYPDLFDRTLDEPASPSCSAFEALERQDALINDAVATQALSMLWNLLRWGKLCYAGAYINLELGLVSAVPITEPKLN